MQTDAVLIEQTKKWITNVVIGCQFCPFAAGVMKISAAVRFSVLNDSSDMPFDKSFLNEIKVMEEDPRVETSFIVFNKLFPWFEDYLKVVDISNWLLRENKYTGIYQVASFHPSYCFNGSHENDAANYTNRSPHPMLQIIRETSVEKARLSYPGVEQIPERNILYAQNKGIKYMQDLLNSCFE